MALVAALQLGRLCFVRSSGVCTGLCGVGRRALKVLGVKLEVYGFVLGL